MGKPIQLTVPAMHAVSHAKELAEQVRCRNPESVHLLCGIAAEEASVGAVLLLRHGICSQELTARLRDLEQASEYTMESVISRAAELAKEMHCSIGTAHLLYAVLELRGSKAVALLLECGGEPATLLKECRREMTAIEQVLCGRQTGNPSKSTRDRTPFTTDLTALALQGKLDPLIGRQKEIDLLLSILSRQKKNNVCLIGEPGVGKTAIMEGVAQELIRMRGGRFCGRRLLTLELGSLLAGARYRGDLEERLLRVIRQAEEERAILFIDEVHMIVGTGGNENGTDCANLLKPVLARGSLQIIGATTQREYHKYIEADAALARRFQVLRIEEPDAEATVSILRGLVPSLSAYHHVRIEEAAVRQAVRLAQRCFPLGHFPDKAIDLLDEACGRCSLQKEAETTDTEERILQEIRVGNYAAAAKRFALEYAEETVVSGEMVAALVEEKTGIPVKEENPAQAVQQLKKVLEEKLAGQKAAKDAICQAVLRYKSGFHDGKTAGSFLFVGPTGVGKTYAAQITAQQMFGKEGLIRIDLSEYSEAHAVSRLIGAPPGYVGYRGSTTLTERIRRNPYALLLLDEADKAHPQVLQLLLQILENGELTDACGEHADFRHCMIVLTANRRQGASLGFKSKEGSARAAIDRQFPAELLNRIDHVIAFEPLDVSQREQAARLLADHLIRRAERAGITLRIEDSVFAILSDLPECTEFGVRPIRRYIEQELETILLSNMVSHPLCRHFVIRTEDRIPVCRIYEPTDLKM